MVLGQGRGTRERTHAQELVSEHGEHPPFVSWFSKHSSVLHGDIAAMDRARRACSLVSCKLESSG